MQKLSKKQNTKEKDKIVLSAPDFQLKKQNKQVEKGSRTISCVINANFGCMLGEMLQTTHRLVEILLIQCALQVFYKRDYAL